MAARERCPHQVGLLERVVFDEGGPLGFCPRECFAGASTLPASGRMGVGLGILIVSRQSSYDTPDGSGPSYGPREFMDLPRRLEPDALFGERYRIVRSIRTGGMGAVYEASHLETGRRVAIKVMLPSLVSDPTLRARFKLEATVAASVESEHIVDVFDAGIDPSSGSPFLVMELLRGDDISSILKQRGPMTAEEVVELMWQAGLALDRTHARGIVHRDLKPDNLFVTTRDDGSPRLKILDFGIAKVMAQNPSGGQQTATVGTPLYMAPEQINGDAIEPACDLYSLAHIAYSMLVGRSYWSEEWQGGPIYPLLLKVLKGATEPATVRAERCGKRLPKAFDAWFERATAQSSGRRYATAKEMLEELASSLGVAAPGHRRQRRTYDPTVTVVRGTPNETPSPQHVDDVSSEPSGSDDASRSESPLAEVESAAPPPPRRTSGSVPEPANPSKLPATSKFPDDEKTVTMETPAPASANTSTELLRPASHPSLPDVRLRMDSVTTAVTPTGIKPWLGQAVPTPPSGVGFNVERASTTGPVDPPQASGMRDPNKRLLVAVALVFSSVICGAVLLLAIFLKPPNPSPGASTAPTGTSSVAVEDPVSLEAVAPASATPTMPASTSAAAPSIPSSASTEAPASASASVSEPVAPVPPVVAPRPFGGHSSPTRRATPDPVGTSFY